MNDTFNFKKDHPELYAKVQYQKSMKRHVTLVSFVLSVVINLIILSVLSESGANMSSLIFVTGWIFFSTPFAIKTLVEWATINWAIR